MAEAAVSFLLEKVNQLLNHHTNYLILFGADKELRKLQRDFDLLKRFLQDASEEEGELKDLKIRIRDATWVVEDTIDACLDQTIAARTIRARFIKWRAERELPIVVKSLRESVVRPILNSVSLYRSTTVFFAALNAIEKKPRSTGEKTVTSYKAHVRRDNVVGFKDEEEAIIGSLLKENERLDVISIVGMSGLGKTTLAWKIYQNEYVAYTFHIRIWIHVSQNLNMRDVMLNILRSFFTSQDISSMNDHELIQTVSACLKEERFFLVFDNVRSLEDWQAIQEFLPESNGKGKVLITTSNKNVGFYGYKYKMQTHVLRFLNPEESWTLLQLEVFGKLGACPRELETTGKLIASKCAGLPLKIAVVGGILVDKQRGLWENVLENVKLFTDDKTSILDAVGLTYSRLPDEQRICFLYMGVFPEDYEIPVWTLTCLWIAEGFIQQRNARSLEESAYQNLDDLITRNLVMAGKLNAKGEVKTCRVHELIGAFCRDEAEQQNLFQVTKGLQAEQQNQFQVTKGLPQQRAVSRRLCVHSNADMYYPRHEQRNQLRSFLCFNVSSTYSEPRYISALPDDTDLLKVLESKSTKFHQLPRNISRMFHLRYITMSIDGLRVLPRTLSQLWNLQTLAVDTESRIIEMRANIWRMIGLRHVKTNAVIVLSPKDKGPGGRNIQTLNSLSPKSCTEDLFARAPNLKTLGIRGKLTQLINASLGKMVRLEKLKLADTLCNETTPDLRDLPNQYFFPPNLKRLTLSNTFFQWKNMSTLANINTLEVLKLKDNAFVGIYWKVDDDSFSRLEFLLISNTDLVLWEPSPSSFPRLNCLVVKNCENLKEIPKALSKTLVKLDIDRLRGSAVHSAMRIADEKKKGQELEEIKWEVPFKLHIGPPRERK